MKKNTTFLKIISATDRRILKILHEINNYCGNNNLLIMKLFKNILKIKEHNDQENYN